MENVEEFIDRRIPSGNILSPLEMVAALSLIAANEPFTNVVKALTGMCDEGMGEYFNDRFFVTLQHTVRDLMGLGLDKEAGDLLKIGQIAARIHNRAQWVDKFSGQIDAGLSSRIRDYPFLTQRGW